MPVYSVARLGTLGVVRDYMPVYLVVRKGTQGVGVTCQYTQLQGWVP